MKQFTSKTQKIGELGEKICTKYLREIGFTLIELNYTKKSGEIDIIAEKNDILHFIEVKSVQLKYVSYETYNPAENLTKSKYAKILKTTNVYLDENSVSHETKWQIDLYCVFINRDSGKHKINRIENIVFS